MRKSAEKHKMNDLMNPEDDPVKYLLYQFHEDILSLLKRVMSDDSKKPESSAVILSNRYILTNDIVKSITERSWIISLS